jgi:hypothetical protein
MALMIIELGQRWLLEEKLLQNDQPSHLAAAV